MNPARVRTGGGAVRSPRRIVDLIWLLLGVLLSVALFAPPATTAQALGLRRFLTPPIARGWRVVQRFRMNSRSLTSVEIRPAVVGPVDGSYRLMIRDSDAPQAQRSTDISAATLAGQATYTFEFVPFPNSKDHEFELEVIPTPNDPGDGIALWVAKGTPSDDRVLLFNDSPRWGTLAFATRTTVSPVWRVLLSDGSDTGLPRWWGMVALCGIWLATRFVVIAFLPVRGATVIGNRPSAAPSAGSSAW
jgi:hypothetical protein